MAGVNLIGNSIGTYQPPAAAISGVPSTITSTGSSGALPSGVNAQSPSGSSIIGDVQNGISAGSLGNRLLGSSGSSTLGTSLGAAGDFLSMYNGLQRGGAAGYAGAALSGIKGANAVDSLATGSGFLSSGAAAGIGAAGDVLGIYNGIKQGGALGYGSAALDAYNLYGAASSFLGAGSSAAGAAGSGAAGAAAPALGAVAGGISAVAAPVGVALEGAMSAPFTVSPQYWTNMISQLQGKSGNTSANSPISAATQQSVNTNQAKNELLNTYLLNKQGYDTSDVGGNKGNTIPASVIAAYPGGAKQFYADAAALQSANANYGKTAAGGTGGGSGSNQGLRKKQQA